MLPLSLHHTQAAAGRWLGSCSSSHSVARPCRWICVRVGGTFRVQAILMLFLVCTFCWAHTCNFPSQSEMRGEPFLYSEGELISRPTSLVILCLFSRWAQKPRPAGLCVSSFSYWVTPFSDNAAGNGFSALLQTKSALSGSEVALHLCRRHSRPVKPALGPGAALAGRPQTPHFFSEFRGAFHDSLLLQFGQCLELWNGRRWLLLFTFPCVCWGEDLSESSLS